MWKAASQAVRDEEETKKKLCDNLNQLVCLFSFVLLIFCLPFSQYYTDVEYFVYCILNRSKKAQPLNLQDWRS